MKKAILIVLLVNAFLLAGRLVEDLVLRAQAAPEATENGDTNGDGLRDLSDAIFLLDWLFLGGPEPVALAGSPDLADRVGALEASVARIEGSQPSVEAVAAELASRHADQLRGPPGPPGVPGDADPVQIALERLASLAGSSGDAERGGGTHGDVWSQPSRPFRKALCGADLARDIQLSIAGRPVREVLGFHIDERMSGAGALEAIVEDPPGSLDPAGDLGSAVELSFRSRGRTMVFRGEVERIEALEAATDRTVYHIRGYDKLHRLTRGRGSRTFMDRSADDIAREIVLGANVPARFDLEGMYSPREYAVQYRETDLGFVSRLLEEEGIHYVVDHEADGGGTVVFGDGVSGRRPPTGGGTLPYYRYGTAPAAAGAHISSLRKGRGTVPGLVTVADYDLRSAQVRAASAPVPGGTGGAGGAGEDYEFGVNLLTSAALQQRAAVEAGRMAVRANEASGTSDVADLRPGREITVDGTGLELSGRYLVTAVRHTFVRAEDGGEACGFYANGFACIPSALPFRPARSTAKPRIDGALTAVVTGPAGEELYPDRYGRVKVRLHWDLEGPGDESSSAWIRVSQLFAGGSSGFYCLPEVGDEVLVAFLDGDPDRPVIVGSLWNGINVPPLDPVASKGQRILRTERRNGPPGGANEILLDDSSGSERIAFTAPRVSIAAPSTVVSGKLSSSGNAGASAAISPGDRHRDNAIVAWARVSANGATLGRELGVSSVKILQTGTYQVVLDAAAASPGELIPTAAPELPAPPRSAEEARLVFTSPIDEQSFNVFVVDGLGRAASGAFVFLATAR